MRVTYKITKGIKKEKCEDSALIHTQVVNGGMGSCEINDVGRFFVSDGVGGNAGGDEASAFVMNQIAGLKLEDQNEKIRSDFLGINDALIEYAKSVQGHELMAATVTGLFFEKDRVVLVHCGNTRIYAIQGNFLKQVTSDQTTYQWLLDTGNEKVAAYCNKSEIRGAFGGGTSKFADTLIVKNVFERGIPGKILMTSDGIHDVLSVDEIEEIVTDNALSSENKVNQLISSALEKGTMDDCTAIFIETRKAG